MSEDVAPSPIVRPSPDPERDARVARRRAADARKAGRALDALLATPDDEPCGPLDGGGWTCRPWLPCRKAGGCLLPDDDGE